MAYRSWCHPRLTVTWTGKDSARRIRIRSVLTLCFISKQQENRCVIWERKRGGWEEKLKGQKLNQSQQSAKTLALTLLCDESTVRHMPQSRNVTHYTGEELWKHSVPKHFVLSVNASSHQSWWKWCFGGFGRNWTPDEEVKKRSTDEAIVYFQ